MAEAQPETSVPELREYVMENEQAVFRFCLCMLGRVELAERTVLQIFQKFGQHYRKMNPKKDRVWDNFDLKCLLFQIGLQTIIDVLTNYEYEIEGGRDLRDIKGGDDDLLRHFSEMNGGTRNWEEFSQKVRDRLLFVDPDFRAPVVLRDILGLSDEEVMRVMSVRWGVYRHRLHRGRMELIEYLHGYQKSNGAPGGSAKGELF